MLRSFRKEYLGKIYEYNADTLIIREWTIVDKNYKYISTRGIITVQVAQKILDDIESGTFQSLFDYEEQV